MAPKRTITKKAPKPVAKPAKPQTKKPARKLSQIAAAIKVLAEAKEPMNSKAEATTATSPPYAALFCRYSLLAGPSPGGAGSESIAAVRSCSSTCV